MEEIGRTKNGGADRAGQFLELFYPIHYRLGMALEDALRVGAVSRKQVAILWLIRCEGQEGRSIRRKDVQHMLADWFEISSPSVSKALRSMSRPPLELVKILEDPRSGREKRLELTKKGELFLSAMAARGRAFFAPMISELSAGEADEGLRFLRNVTAILERSLQKSRPPARLGVTVASSRSRRRTSRREAFLAAD